MATDYCAANEDAAYLSADPYPCDNTCEMVLSIRSLATALIYFRDRDRRIELLDFRVLCRKVWRRLKADAQVCAGTATGGRAVAGSTGDRYRLQFNDDLEDVHEFTSSFASTSVGSLGSGPLHSIHGNQGGDLRVFEDPKADIGLGIAYQLIDDDASGVARAL